MSPIVAFFVGWFLCAVLMVFLYLYQRVRGEADIVDAGWSASIGLLALWYAWVIPGYPDREFLVVLFAGCWAVRLTWFLVAKRVLHRGEDARYKLLRARWGEHAQRNFFIFFQAQAFLAALLSISFLIVISNPVPSFVLADVLGGMLFVVALGGEIVADYQLQQFRLRSSSDERVCRTGLWRYSRHPNYFFEWLHWISYVFLAWSGDYLVLSCIAPAVMLYLLLYVTGVPAAEASSLASRGEEYRRYQKTTSAFFPWFPKKG